MRDEKKKIAIVWANPYNRNLGVAALAYSSLAIFYDILKENSIDGDITFLGSYKSGKDQVIIGENTIDFDNVIGLDYLNWKSFIKILLQPGKYRISKLLGFDYVFDLAEGDSFSDIYGDFRFFRIYNSKRLFSFLGKKQFLLPQTIGPFNNPAREEAAKAIMKKMKVVISRDKKSYNYTASFLPKEKITEMIDVAFYMPFVKKSFSNDKINVGINVSGLLWNGGYTGNNQFNMKTDYKKLIRHTLDFFTTKENIQIHLISHVIPENSRIEDDSIVASDLLHDYPNAILSPRFGTPVEAKSYISGMDFFTGARMHACIAAFSSGVPVVPMAYSRKFNGLFVDTLEYKWLGDCVNTDENVVLDTIIKGFENREHLSVEIDKSNESIVKPRLIELKKILLKAISS